MTEPEPAAPACRAARLAVTVAELAARRDEHLAAASACDLALAALERHQIEAPGRCHGVDVDRRECAGKVAERVCLRCLALVASCRRHGGRRAAERAVELHACSGHHPAVAGPL